MEVLIAVGAIAVTILAAWLRTHLRGGGKLPASVRLALRIFLGVVLLILGVIGSLLPVLQGWIFFLLAALVLFPKSRFAVKACDKIEPKMPRFIGWLRRHGIGAQQEPEA